MNHSLGLGNQHVRNFLHQAFMLMAACDYLFLLCLYEDPRLSKTPT